MRDAELIEEVRTAHAENLGVYGARKARAELRRKGVDMARVNAGDLDGVVALYEAEAILALPGQGFAAGHDDIRRYYADLLASKPTFEPATSSQRFGSVT